MDVGYIRVIFITLLFGTTCMTLAVETIGK